MNILPKIVTSLFLLFNLSVGISCDCAKYNPKKYISFTDVLSYIWTHYEVEGSPGFNNLKFIKSPKGYELTIHTIELNQVRNSKSILVWSFEEQEFTDSLRFFCKKNTTESLLKSQFENLKTRFYYDIRASSNNLFYGYPKAHLDIIEKLRCCKGLTNSGLNFLARAYEAEASSAWVSREMNNESTLDRYDKDFIITDSVLKAIEKSNLFLDSSLKIYKELLSRDPKYKTVVGSVKMKIANIYSMVYQEMKMFGLASQNKHYLKLCHYDEFYLQYCRMLLNQCPKNAILFTAGDNDTFPLYYLQNKDEVRTDVKVININLMRSPRVRNFLRKSYDINFNIKSEIYQKQFLIFNQQNYTSLSFYEFSKNLNSTDHSLETIYCLKPNKYVLQDGTTLNFDEDIYYIMDHMLACLDVMKNNNEYPICFSRTAEGCFDKIFTDIDNYRNKEGLIYYLGKEDSKFKIQTKDFLPITIVNKEFSKDHFIRLYFGALIGELKKKKTKALINTLKESIQNTKINGSYTFIIVLDVLLSIEEYNIALELFKNHSYIPEFEEAYKKSYQVKLEELLLSIPSKEKELIKEINRLSLAYN